MKTILATTYAVNPYKGSEEGTGWNFLYQIARYHHVIAVTRKNNRPHIEKYMLENPDEVYHRMQFLYFDLPKWMIVWKKGPLLSALYFYIWQCCLAFWLKRKKLSFDLAHSVNFHSNWTPSFLWILNKPFFWGPVGNHPLIPAQYIRPVYGNAAWLKDRLLWMMKCFFWRIDPFVRICRKKATKVFCVNTQSIEKLHLTPQNSIWLPAVATEPPAAFEQTVKDKRTVLSVGRLVPLKGFDLTIRSFEAFYKSLPEKEQDQYRLLIIGSGPEKRRLQKMILETGLDSAMEIKEWMTRAEVIAHFQNAWTFLFPSHEGAGMVVPEAMSYGVPVVCLNNYGPGEYAPLLSGLKVPQGTYTETVQRLAAQLHGLQDPIQYRAESSMALDRYQQQFTWNSKGELLKKVYDHCLNKSSQ